jgi:predicted alpha-1,2-mannosidase
MLKGANDPGIMVHTYSARPHLAEYLRNGYVAAVGKRYGPASISLEYESADFAISRFAQAMGEAETARVFLTRSAQWNTLFDPVTRYIRPRDASGKFLANFDPSAERGFVEGNAAQYTWMVPYDVKGLVSAIGGAAAVNARLDEYFKAYSSAQPTRFNIGNEPSFSNPWIYNWTGQPWRTQEVVRETLDTLFHDAPGGLPGNDDLGATSSWIVFASLGIYPAIPAVGGFTINTPLFPDATIQLGPRQLHISANGAPLRRYVEAVHLDSRVVRDYWISWDDLAAGSHLSFSLSTTPNRHPIASTPPSFAPNRR